MIPDRDGVHYECITCKRQRQSHWKYLFEKRKRQRAAANVRDMEALNGQA